MVLGRRYKHQTLLSGDLTKFCLKIKEVLRGLKLIRNIITERQVSRPSKNPSKGLGM